MKRIILLLATLLACAMPALAEPTLDDSVLATIPIQNEGRLKPLDTFARETVFQITGKERFEGRSAIETLLNWLVDPKAARKAAVIDVGRDDVRRALELPYGRRTSMDDLLAAPRFKPMAREITEGGRDGRVTSGVEKQVERLISRVNLFEAVLAGEAWTVVPDPRDVKNSWTSLAAIESPESSLSSEARKAVIDAFSSLLAAYQQRDNGAFLAASRDLRQRLAAIGPQPDPRLMQMEVHYNNLRPFAEAWMLYLAAFLVLAASGALRSRKLYVLGCVIACGGLIVHAYGFYLRCTIAGRPPVTNMYESVIWVSFGAMLCALILEAVYRGRTLLMAAAAVSTICLILADNTSAVLDPAINPLTPVLRSNFWLTIHVLTITLSYAVFALSLGIGHVILWGYGFHPTERDLQRALHRQLYKSVQIGVLLLAAGTILGGVWANYSWGRFWGWDPKEVWALIALLGYLAVLHGRYAGWLKDFGFAVGAVIAFCGVLMAWYGVNFVLGAGLHAYGFSSGGQGYVAGAVLGDLLFVGAMVLRYLKWKNSEGG